MDHALPAGGNYLRRENPNAAAAAEVEASRTSGARRGTLAEQRDLEFARQALENAAATEARSTEKARRNSLGAFGRKYEDVRNLIGSRATRERDDLKAAREEFRGKMGSTGGGGAVAIDVSHILGENDDPMQRSEERLMGALADLNDFVVHMNAVTEKFRTIESTRMVYESSRSGVLGSYAGASKDVKSEKQALIDHFTENGAMKLGLLCGLLRTPGVRIAFKLEARPLLESFLELYRNMNDSFGYSHGAIEGALEMCSRFVGSPIDFRPRIEDGLTDVMKERAGDIFDAVSEKGIDWSQEGLWRIPGDAGEVEEAFNLYQSVENQMVTLMDIIGDMDAKTALSLVMKIVRDDLTRRDIDLSDVTLMSLVDMLVATVEAEGNKMDLPNLVTSFPYASELMI